ncbi:MAG TPA: acyltransferase [Thermoanaerobaculia bacterium]|jgi:peptidoglycan/LPS O-acetylase OafA/YrhL
MSTDTPARDSRFDYIPPVDGLRAVAVLAVIVFHLRPWRLPGGYTGVDIFFVISGFVVTWSLRGTSFSRLGELLRYFYARRVIRIVPALAAMLVVTTLMTLRFAPTRETMTASSKTALAASAGVSNVYLSFSRSGYFGAIADRNPFLHTWTLGVEEQFYFLFPFLYFLWQRNPERRKRGAVIVAALSGVSLLLCAALSGALEPHDFFLMPPRFWELGVGMLLALTSESWQPRAASAGTAVTVAGFALSFAALGAGLSMPFHERFPFPGALLPVTGTAGMIVLACSRPHALAIRALSHPIPVYLGRISYSLYLWHWPTFVLFRWTVGMDGRLEAASALLISFLAANGSYYLLERPLRRSTQAGRMPRLRLIGAGLCLMAGVAGAILVLFRP